LLPYKGNELVVITLLDVSTRFVGDNPGGGIPPNPLPNLKLNRTAHPQGSFQTVVPNVSRCHFGASGCLSVGQHGRQHS
jgi:hypothetical protein